MTNFNSNGFNINFEKFDNTGENNVLFIHGNLACNEWWYPAIEIMKGKSNSDSRGVVLTADWRGFGESRGLTDVQEINFDTFADDYINLLEHHNLENVHVVGHSTGGLIAMKAVLKKPELFKSLVLLDSVGPKGIELEIPLENVLAHFEQMSQNREYCMNVLAATIEGVDVSSNYFQTLFEKTWNCDNVMWKGVIEKLCTEIDIVEQAKALTLPTLIIHGEKDLVLPLKGAEFSHSVLPNSTLKVMPGHGHSFNVENPAGFVEECMAFWSN
jgi:pimeloyl-ACP methyl ester carboxylesterase